MTVSRILLNRGHGKDNTEVGVFDTGAVSPLGREADVVARIAGGVDVHYNYFLPVLLTPPSQLSTVIKWINATAQPGDILVSLHMNEGGGRGTECIISHLAPPERREQAAAFTAAVSKTLGIPNRGVKLDTETPRGHLGILNGTVLPAFLLEIAFIDSLSDMTKVNAKGVTAVCQGLNALRAAFATPQPIKGEMP